MKKILLPVVLLFYGFGISQTINVNNPADPETSFTPEEMITEVLIGGVGCGEVVFQLLQENPDGVGDLTRRSWGYFDATGTSFPFQEGVILSTGFAVSAEGPNDVGGSSDTGTGWNGDNDLKIILDNQSGDNQPTNNATIFQFDFVPVISQMSFEFIFASEEYENEWECTSDFRDGFAFLLRGPGIPDDSGTPFGGTNIAAIPGSNNVPVSTLSIHSDTFLCGTEIPGVNFFPELYVSNDGPNNLNEIQFDGHTTSLTAQAILIPGETYTLKMVIADRGDTAFDSAVFFKAGSFSIGVNLGDDVTVAAGTAPCEGEFFEISVDGDASGQTTYRWFVWNPVTMMFDEIIGETGNSIIVTQSGTYKIEATVSGGCVATDEIVVEFAPQPIAVVPDDIIICDTVPNDGFAEFDLTIRDAQIQNGQPNTFVEYYFSLAAAEAGMLPFVNPNTYTNSNPGFQIVFARLEEITLGCYDIVPLVLQVDMAPTITAPISDYFICDNDVDGVEVFDLTTKDSEIVNILINITLTYHTTQADALSGINAIVTPGIYPSGGELIWVRAENLASCVTVGSFLLVLGDIPLFVIPTPFEQCDDEVADGITEFDLNMKNGEISGGDINLSITYYATQPDAQAAINPLPIPYTNTVNPELIWVRIEDNITGCYGTTPLELIVVEAPEIFEPDPLTYCDQDNDGFGEFILSDADSQVTGGNPGGNLIVTYHLTLEDAQNGDQPILDVPYLNVDPFAQLIYVRLFDQSTGCYNITTLLLLVLDSPQISAPSPLVICDDDGDGIALFDLTLSELEILNGLDPLDYTVTYFEDPGLTIPIVNTTNYPNITNPQTIYVVVEDIGNGCQSLTTLELQVNLPPTLVAPTPLELCDVNNPGDEMEPFDLESKTSEITGGNLSIVITYHQTQGDADIGINALVSPYVNQVPQPQTIFIRGEDITTGCIVSQGFTLDLVVNPLPSPVTPTPLEVCDQDNDGFAEFDLNSKTAEIIGGEPGVSVTYHETLIDAQNGAFVLVSPYTNIQTPTQVVYARAEYAPILGGTGCFRIVELELIVNPTPLIPLELDPLLICDDDGDGIAIFDLTLRADDIYGSQDPLDYTLTYHTSLADAQSGINPIGTPQSYMNLTNPETIYVRLEDNVTGCVKTGEFEIEASIGPVVVQPLPLTLCDDLGVPNDGITVFDLTVKNDEITGGGGANIGVSYYETQGDADNDINAIDPDTAYTNLTNPQTIYVRVSDGNTSCFDTTVNLTLRVEANPEPQTPDPIALCDENDPGDQIEVFDLTTVEPQVLNGEDWDVTYHLTLTDALDNTNAIVDPTAHQNVDGNGDAINPQTIYIRVTNNNNPEGCFEIVELELIVNPLPDDTALIEDYIICEIGSDGIAIFDLTTKIDEILGGQDPGIFTVTFYETDLDAGVGINAIINPTDYQNDGSASPPGQTIWVGILNTDTGCYVGGVQSFNLQVLEGAVANPPSLPYAICDNLGDNDGIGQFDFILFDSNINGIDIASEILGGQDPSVYLITYHETFENADLNMASLPDLYTNIINPQVVYVRVTNISTNCYAITELVLKVEELPIIDIADSYRLCVDADGNPLPAEEGEESPPVIDTGLDPGVYSFEWEINGVVDPSENFPFIVAVESGLYIVTVTEIATGCSSEADTRVILSSPPLIYSAEVVSGIFGINEVIHTDPQGNTVTLTDTHVIHVEVEGLGEYVFQLDDGPFQEEDLFTNVLPGVHIITIKDINGCGSVTIELIVIDYPRFVTPNQDGYHDTWNIIGMAIGDPTAKIYIFDRFGKLLKQISPIGEGWDGNYNGNPLPSSDYWFRVEYLEDETPKEFKGHFTLKR